MSRASLTAVRPTTQHYGALFVEDEWKIGNSLTIRPGVRYEQETLSGTLVQDFSLENNWAPRVGVVWDPSNSGKAKVFANYGRYYARVPSDLAARALSSDASITADYFDANLTRPVPNGTVTTNATTGAATTTHFTLLGAGGDEIDPNAKLSYYNEWVVGDGIHGRSRARRRRALRPPRHRPGARRRAAVPDRRDLTGPARRRHGGLPADQSRPEHAGRPGHPGRDGRLRVAGPRLQRGRVHGEQAAGEQLVADLVVSMVAADRQLRGLLPQRQRAVRSRDLVALRLSDQRSDLHDDRRAAVRLPRRHPFSRRGR